MRETTYSPEFAPLQRVVAGRYSLVREIGAVPDVTRDLEQARALAERLDEAAWLRAKLPVTGELPEPNRPK